MTTDVRKAVAEEVALELRRAGRPKPWLAVKAGIPYSTLSRKLRAQADFTFTDLAKIAEALGVSPSVFTPDVCLSASHPGSALKQPGTRRRSARASY
jgi:hypothetical protein